MNFQLTEVNSTVSLWEKKEKRKVVCSLQGIYGQNGFINLQLRLRSRHNSLDTIPIHTGTHAFRAPVEVA